ncbi:uncharacterized protein [Ptychodera flava]|uniref:uncharacterized protein n=1 Tax=Ptychodera flava TaxID=63121 RepID=UPI00396A19E0
MLRRVIVENYVNFTELQDLNFSPKHQHNLYLFVGENGSGKSSLLELIEYAALDFSSKEITEKINVRDKKKDALMLCSFEIDTEDEDMLTSELHRCLRDNHKDCGDGEEEEEAGEKQEEGNKKLFAGFFFDHMTGDTVKFYFLKSQTSCIACIEGYGDIDNISHEDKTSHERYPSTGSDDSDEVLSSVAGVKSFLFDWRYAHKIKNNATEILRRASRPHSMEDGQTIYKKIITYTKKKIRKSFSTGSFTPPMQMTSADKGSRQDYHRRVSHLCATGKIDRGELQKIMAEIIGNDDIELHDDLDEKDEFVETRVTQTSKDRNERIKQIRKIQTSYNDNSTEPATTSYCWDKITKQKFYIDQLPSGLASAFEIASQLARKEVKTLLLDEPSQCMHISQIKRLRQVLLRYSAKEKRRCIIVTTHSPRMIDSKNFYNVFRFRKDTGESFVRRILRYNQKTIRFIIDPRVSEIFFAEAVLWVEGADEIKFLESLSGVLEDLLVKNYTGGSDSKMLETVLDVLKYHTVLPLNGKDNLGKVGMCDQLQISKVVICDLDAVLPADSDLKTYRKQNDNSQSLTSTVEERKAVSAAKCLAKDIKGGLADCKTVKDILDFYQEHRVFAWSVGDGNIEDIIQIAQKSQKRIKLATFSEQDMDGVCQTLINSNHDEIKRFFSFLSNFKH